MCYCSFFFFFKQKTAYEMRISDWSSDVCSSDLLIVFGVIAFLGFNALRNVPVDAFPDVTPVQVNVYTESPGLAAEDVELLLTTPVESALAGLPKVQQIRSVSLFGLSYVAVYFEDDMDIYFARQDRKSTRLNSSH